LDKSLPGLLHYGIDGVLLKDCLQAAEAILDEDSFNRWPSVPVRGFWINGGRVKLKAPSGTGYAKFI